MKYGLIITHTAFNHPVFIACADDPLRKFDVYWTEALAPKWVATLHVPTSAIPNADSDGSCHIVDEQHLQVMEMWKGRIRADGDCQGRLASLIDLRGPGVYDTYHGACAYGASTIGGVIRTGERRTGIRHALRMSITPVVLNPNAPGGKGHVWPANANESNYTGTGNIHMGSLLAIPPEVDIRLIAGSPGTPAYELARALQDYGAYVVDRGHLNLYTDREAQADVKAISLDARKRIANSLVVVVNNGRDAVGGGGTKRNVDVRQHRSWRLEACSPPVPAASSRQTGYGW